MGQRTSSCRACGATITFIKTQAGKTMPVDANAVSFVAGGSELFVLPDGSTAHGTRCEYGKGDQTEQIGYISHFATCPSADRFRKPRKSDRKKA